MTKTQKGKSIEVENSDNDSYNYSIAWDAKGIGFYHTLYRHHPVCLEVCSRNQR